MSTFQHVVSSVLPSMNVCVHLSQSANGFRYPGNKLTTDGQGTIDDSGMLMPHLEGFHRSH